MSESLEYLRYTVLEDRPGLTEAFLCSLVVAAPVAVRNPEVAKAIEAELPAQEKWIRDFFLRKGFYIPQDAKLRFQVSQQNPLPADYEGKPPDFVSGDGKKFWIER